MKLLLRLSAAALLLLSTRGASAAPDADEPTPTMRAREDHGDLFPAAGRPTVSLASGLPFLGIAEVGYAITDGIAIGAIGGITPSVLTAGVRPRFRVATSAHTSLVISMPMLYYPQASAPGPGDIGTTSWVLTRPELFLDGAIGDRWHVAGGAGFIAAASLVALGQTLEGRKFAVPAYNGSTETKTGFAGGIWNTFAARASYAMSERSHLFAEGSLVMKGLVFADGLGGPPIVVTVGAQHSF